MTETEEKSQKSKALEMMRAVHEDKCATINGRDYHITTINHGKRRKVFAYFTHIQNDLQRKDLIFMSSPEWAEVERIIDNCVTFEGNLISKINGHWEDYPEDYVLFCQTMLGALSYPFLRGLVGG